MGGFMEYIYIIKNKMNGKSYIGKTKRPNRRLIEHKMLVGKKRHKLYDAIQHYGWENFDFEIIDETTSENINNLEIFYIKKFNTILEGYNYISGGTGGDTFTNRNEYQKDITRKKLSDLSLKKSNEEYRKKMSEITKKNWTLDDYRKKTLTRHMEVIQTQEYKDKVSKGIKKKLENLEMRKLWSDVKKGNKNGRWLGYIVVYDNNGVEHSQYESAVDAEKKLGIPAHTIRVKAKNGEPYKCVKKGKHYYGYTFKLVVENKKDNI